ncbi:MAG: UDP-N-acetylmuramate dehydrogenase [Proteobacteria bacterium]|nr:UDP-N-acetylmuramate dehydrogenase [Pseudomonadota bacterium]
MKPEAKNLTLNNSFKLRSKAINYYEFNSNKQLNSFFKNSHDYEDLSIVGEGTNSIFPSVFHGTVLRSTNESITEALNSDSTIKVGAGCNWDYLVDECVNNQLFGLENLAGIPGSVGAAPIQNIGAYGKELSQFLTEVEVYDLKEKIFKTLSNEECKFGYRTSIFQLHKEFLITSVTIKLEKVFQPYMAYKDLENKKIDSSKEMVELIRTIRDDKLPDRESFPNVGSFFKNPVLSQNEYDSNEKLHKLTNVWREGVSIKLSAAELIELAGLKGIKINNVGVSLKHALVLTCTGIATQKDLVFMTNLIRERVKNDFDLDIKAEPNFL